jgi:hypothetical protein
LRSRPRANERHELFLARKGAYLSFERYTFTPPTPPTPPPDANFLLQWHAEPKDKGCQSWGNWDVNTAIFPDMAGFAAALHEHGSVTGYPLKISFNVHPQTGIDHCDTRYATFARLSKCFAAAPFRQMPARAHALRPQTPPPPPLLTPKSTRTKPLHPIKQTAWTPPRT